MDIYIAIDKKDLKKFIFKAEIIKKELESKNRTVKYLEKENIELNKNSLCIVFSNNLEYIEKIHKNNKLDLILISSRLEGEYIIQTLNYVKDIYFLNIGVKEVVMRIKGFEKRYEDRKKCIRGKKDAF